MSEYLITRRSSDPTRTGLVAKYLFVLWLVGATALPVSFGFKNPAVRTMALVWPVPLLLLMGRRRSFLAPAFAQRPWRFVGVALVFASASLSVTISPDPKLSMEMVLVTLAAMLICAGFWAIVGGDDLSPIRTYAWVSVAVFLIALARIPAYVDGRLTFGGMDANSVGLILQSVTIASLALKRVPVRVAGILASMYVMSLTDSRSALIGTTLALLMYFALRRGTLLIWSMTAILLVSAALVAIGSQSVTPVTDYVSELLQLNNSYRGVSTGFTGRKQLWEETIEIWQEHPLIGSGYRAIQDLLPQRLSSHDGYLEILGETGIFGALCMALFFSQGIRSLIVDAKGGSQVAQLGLALTTGYLFVAIFERYFINFGNPTSLLVLCMWLRPTTTRGLRGARIRYAVKMELIPENLGDTYAYTYDRFNNRLSR